MRDLTDEQKNNVCWTTDSISLIGMKNDIAGVNSSITQGWANKAMGGGNVNVTQNNEYTFTNPMQYGAAASTNNDWASSFT